MRSTIPVGSTLLLILSVADHLTPMTAAAVFVGKSFSCSAQNFNSIPKCTWTDSKSGQVHDWWLPTDDGARYEIWSSQTVIDPATDGCSVTESKSGDHAGSLATTNLIKGDGMSVDTPSGEGHPAPGKDLAGEYHSSSISSILTARQGEY